MRDRDFYSGDLVYLIDDKQNPMTKMGAYQYGGNWDKVKFDQNELNALGIEKEGIIIADYPPEMGGAGISEVVFVIGSFLLTAIAGGASYDIAKGLMKVAILQLKNKVLKKIKNDNIAFVTGNPCARIEANISKGNVNLSFTTSLDFTRMAPDEVEMLLDQYFSGIRDCISLIQGEPE